MLCVFFHMQPAGCALQPRPNGSALTGEPCWLLLQWNSTQRKYSLLSLEGGQTVQRLEEKTLSFQSLSPPTHIACTTVCKTLKVVFLVHNAAAFPRSVLTGSHDEKEKGMKYFVKLAAKLTLAQDSRYEKVTKQLRNFPTLNSYWKGIKHWIQLWNTQTLREHWVKV